MQSCKEAENVGADQCVRPRCNNDNAKRSGPTHGSAPTSLIKTLALDTGFDVVGITSLDSLQEGERAIEAWMREGRHGTMKYLEDFRARRERLLSEIPDAKSVICLGVNYFQGEQKMIVGADPCVRPQSNGPTRGSAPTEDTACLSGRIARYAWGRDYHTVIREKHEVLIERLKDVCRGEACLAPTFKSCVDTQAIPERFAALQAGLGFIGKHTGILNQTFGPWLFLSEIVTNLDLEEDVGAGSPRPLANARAKAEGAVTAPLQQNGCGPCTRCQDVCPTGALDEDYRIDARLCIAYLTIEYKGVIPRELRPKMKDWIFGCDECLTVCPFTAKQKETTWEEFMMGSDPKGSDPFKTRGSGPTINLEKLFSIPSQKAYERRFEGTALRRASLKQMLRNACVVLGNWAREHVARQDVGAIHELPLRLLTKALGHGSSLVRVHAAWALGQWDTEDAKQILEKHQIQEQNSEVLEEINTALNREHSFLKECP